MNVLAGLMNPAAIGQQITGAFQQGQEQRRQTETRNALAQYAQNPSAEGAAMVAQHDPQTGIQLGRYENERAELQRKTQLEAQKQALTGRAAQGDKAALVSLWGVDWETAKSLDKYQTDKALEGFDYVANAAYQITQLLPEQRAQAWDAYIQQGTQLGFDGLAQYQGQYSDQLLNSVVAKAGEMQQFQKFQQLEYKQRGEFGQDLYQFGRPVDPAGMGALQNSGGGAQAGGIQEGATATNQQTGEKIVFRNGRWAPVTGGGGGNVTSNFLDGF